jgi:hypothetical protein
MSQAPVHVIIIPWDDDTEMASVLHDDIKVWEDYPSSFDQYLRHCAPQGVPVILEVHDA